MKIEKIHLATPTKFDSESNSLNTKIKLEQHHGLILEQAVRKAHIGISEIARKLNISRKTIYNWFETKKISIDILKKVGYVISHDFSAELPEEFACEENYLVNLPGNPSDANTVSKNDEVYYWMERYIKLLENMTQNLREGVNAENEIIN
jgi:hypothetical protein